MTKKIRYLQDVAILRPILVVLCVFYHAFAPYSGAWAPINGFPEVEVYWWLDRLSYASMLEAFVFVSGYVFGFQVRTKGECLFEAKSLFYGKFKRLIIPCMVFSFVYLLLFGDIQQPVLNTVYDVVTGVGHMWFLPMLFWCFVGVWMIERLRMKPWCVLPILVLSAICSSLPLPLQLNAAMYYMFFFYIGYIIQSRNIRLNRFFNWGASFTLAILFFVLFFPLTLFREDIGGLIKERLDGILLINQLIEKFFLFSLQNSLRIIYSFVGLAMLFIFVNTFRKSQIGLVPHWLINVGNLCMGVYLFQQFILKGLYNYTNLPSLLGPYVLPWIGFPVALIGSLLLSYLFRLTKIGRSLIG